MIGYQRSVGAKWPIIIDETRTFEKEVGVKKLGLTDPHNTWEMKIITPDGKMVGGNLMKLEDTINRHLKTATWRVDPDDVPATLTATWKDVEYGRFKRAIPTLRRYLNSRDEKTKAAATKMHDVIATEMNKSYSAAKEAEKDNRKWEAYKLFERVAEDYTGMPEAREAGTAVRRLSKDKDLADEVKAHRALEKTQLQLKSRNRQQRRAATDMLRAIVQRYPETDAGKTAQALLESEDANTAESEKK